MKLLIQKIYVSAIFILLVASCSPTKNLQEDEVYLVSNRIKIPSNIINQDQLSPYLRQRSNKKSLWILKLSMQQYLLFNDSNLTIKNEKKRQKIQAKNQKRIALGKDTIEYKPVRFSRIKDAGEPPVIFDSTLALSTNKQFEKLLFNIGYFNSEVYYELQFNNDSTKVTVTYKTIEGPQYYLNNISLVIADPEISEFIKVANEFSNLHKGNPYNTDVIDIERQRFADVMRNQGFYFFSKEYITYEVDSTIGDNKVDLKIMISNPAKSVADTVTQSSHQRYTIGDVILNTSFNPKYPSSPTDSIHFDGLIYMNLSQFKYKPHTFTNKLFFKTGDYYSERNQARTYTRLSGLNNFKYINISYSTASADSNVLNCNVTMTPFPTQTIGVEAEGTNTSSNLGISGYLNYTHRNIFRNAEHLKIRLKGGIEAQPTNSTGDNTKSELFNTLEYGLETSLIFQTLILPHRLRENILQKFNRPKTSLNFILNYQKRPDFIRFLTNASFGYSFTQKKTNINEVLFYPVDLSFIRIEKSDEFAKRLEELNNPLLDATYDDQFIWGTRILENWTNKKNNKQKTYVLNMARLEFAGNVLHGINILLNDSQKVDDGGNNYYEVGAIRYAQFVKLQNDLHYNSRINSSQFMAYRVLGGLGIPYGNSIALPYDRSFYGGGANDNRGWRARSLGPGSMIDSLKVGVDQVADIKIQLSAEYRFNLFKNIEGAIFADAGNIWLLRADSARANANFDIKRFYKEMAVSVGTGARFNFGFLLVRLDWGFKIFDPNLPVGERFVFKQPVGGYLDNYPAYSGGKSYNYSVLNLGIGYPF